MIKHPPSHLCDTQSVFRGLPELQHLDLYGNKLTSFVTPSDPTLLTKLDYLDVGYNLLSVIPDGIAGLTSLRTFKCMNNAIEIIPAAICDMDLRVLDVSSNPLVQPPLETCERGLHSMRRYYHCLKLEEMAGPDQHSQQQQQHSQSATQQQNKCIFKKRLRLKKSKKKSAFPSALRPSSMFRTSSEPASTFNASQPTASGDGLGSGTAMSHQETPPMRSVSFSLSKEGKGSARNKNHNISDEMDAKDSKLRRSLESDYSDDSASDDEEPTLSENLQLVGLNKAEKMADEITVNDTLKVIFVGMALSGKTSIIKRLIEGKDAKIPQLDERTIGVDIYEWDPKTASGFTDGSLMTQIPVDGELESRIKGNVDVKFSVWDFAGQHVYHVSFTWGLYLSANKCYNSQLTIFPSYN